MSKKNEEETAYVNINIFISQKRRRQWKITTVIRELQKSEKEDGVPPVPCFQRFWAKSLQTKAAVSAKLRSASSPRAVKERGQKSF